ncbi:MAG TPA: glycosyltransferase family 39 protein [Candidatus Saccharimonadales bacterium]|nr:glycosyltransferase family 39 protein [Candidatus Saccharimonadales bacterium]
MIRSLLSRILPIHKLTWWERYFWWLLAGAAVIFMVISLSIGLHQSVWFDEAYSIIVAKQPAAQLVHLTSLDTHPPLYYLLLKAWASMFGWSEFALRSLSVLAAGAALFVGGVFVKRVFGIRVALLAIPFVVLAPFLLRYGFEIRMYSLASLIGIAATYVLVRAWQTKPSRERLALYALYAVLVALGMYTLYYLALLWIAHVVWLVWMTRREKQPLFKSLWLRAFLVSIVLFLPWLPAFISQVSNGALAAISQPMTIDNLVGIVSFGFVYQPTWQLSAVMSLVVLFVITTLIVLSVHAFKLISVKQRPYLVLLALYVAVPVAVLTLVSLARPMYVERYLSHVLIGGMLFIGVVMAVNLAKAKKNVIVTGAALVAVLVIGVMHLSQVGNFNFQRLQSPMVKQAAALMKDCTKNATVFAADPYVAIELDYYLPDCQIQFYSATDTLKGGYAPLSNSPLHVDEPARELALSSKIYYVFYDQQTQTMPSALHHSTVKSFDSLHVATFSVE